LADTGWHPHVAAIIQVERRVYTRNAKTGLLRYSAEAAFYVSNTPVTATRAAEIIRAHWKIENTSHYSRDVTLGEDRSRIRTNPGVFARLRSFAFNILKANQTDTLSQDRYRAGLAGIKNCSHSPSFVRVDQPWGWARPRPERERDQSSIIHPLPLSAPAASRHLRP